MGVMIVGTLMVDRRAGLAGDRALQGSSQMRSGDGEVVGELVTALASLTTAAGLRRRAGRELPARASVFVSGVSSFVATSVGGADGWTNIVGDGPERVGASPIRAAGFFA